MPARILFLGSASFAVPSLAALVDAGYEVPLVVTRPDKPSGRGLEVSQTPVRKFAVERGLPVFQPPGVRTPEVHAVLRDAAPDVAVVAAYGRILPRDILDLPPRGCVNVHGSLLPKYRGAAPIQWAVIRGEAETGVTVMRMDEGLDTGPILSVSATPVRTDDTAATLFDRLADLGAALLARTLPAVLDGTASATPQDGSLATLAPILTKDAGRIDWFWPGTRVADLVRGVEPWPGAFTFTPAGVRLRVFPFVAADVGHDGVPGQVLAIDGDGMVVRAGDGAVRVAQVQPAGSRRMSPRELAAGRRLAVGDVLGDGPQGR
jgi:methionyl-tRNA formyltransferase